MELRHLRTFLVAAETLNISAAARQLGVTQPALSRQIRELEQAVGQALFVRHPGGLRLTAAGARLRAPGEAVVAQAQRALQAARGAGEQADEVLRVGYYGSVGIWNSLLATAIDRLQAELPAITCQLAEHSCGQLVGELRAGRLDLAVLGPGRYPRIPGVQLRRVGGMAAWVLMAANHRLAKKRAVRLTELSDEPIIGLSGREAPERDREFIAACQAAGFTPRIANIAATPQDAFVALKRRGAVAIFGSPACAVPVPGGVFVPLQPPGVRLSLHVAHATAVPAAGRLAALVAAEAGRVLAAG